MKKTKCNGYCEPPSSFMHEEKMDGELTERRITTKKMRNIIEQEKIGLHYQPQIDIASNRVCGYEVLLRWYDKLGRWQLPEDLIEAVERKGLIREITSMVLRRVCYDYAKRREELGNEPESNITCSINVSADDLKDDYLIEQLVYQSDKYQVPRKYLGVEVTETRMMQDIDSSADMIRILSDNGFSVAIDDFGKGYSSLHYLHKLPIKCLKIDRSFIDDLHVCDVSRKIVNTIIQLAQLLNVTCLAEGVENDLQLDILKEFGCEMAQGFYIANPMPFADALAYMKFES